MPASPSSRTALKRYLSSRANTLCNQLLDTSAVALCAADEIMWRYLESSHNPYAKLLHKGLTAGPKKGDATLETTTAEAFDELQAGLAVVTDEELEGRLVATPFATSEDGLELSPFGRFLTSASVTAAITVDEAVRALSSTRLGAIMGLPQIINYDAAERSEWNELHHELSNVVEEEEVCAPSSSPALSRHSSMGPLSKSIQTATLIAKRAVVAAPLTDAIMQAVVNASARTPLTTINQVSQQHSEALAWDELQSHFSC